MRGLTIITPTGDRPEALALLRRYVARQTYRGRLQWIIIDDGRQIAADVPPIPPAGASTFVYTYRRRDEPGVPGGSLNRNLINALRHVQFDRVAIMEDDDWYAPTYLETMAELLDHHPLAGESRSRYYNVRDRRYYLPGNTRWASLCQTGFRREILAEVDASCRRGTPFIDLELWKRDIRGKHLIHNHGLAVGIKGMPGRRGIGQGGHRTGRQYTADPDLRQLRGWIGDDVERYREFHVPPTRRWWDWIEEDDGRDPRPWAIIGKGPTFSRRGEVDLAPYRTIGLNHVPRELPVDVAHTCDIEVIRDVGEVLADRCRVLVMPFHPHEGLAPQAPTLIDRCQELPVLRRLNAEGRLLHYHLLWAEKFKSRPKGEPVVGVKNFSVQPATNLIIGRGERRVVTLGIDGGRERSAEFAGEAPGNQGRGNDYGRQFEELRRIARVNRATITPLLPM